MIKEKKSLILSCVWIAQWVKLLFWKKINAVKSSCFIIKLITNVQILLKCLKNSLWNALKSGLFKNISVFRINVLNQFFSSTYQLLDELLLPSLEIERRKQFATLPKPFHSPYMLHHLVPDLHRSPKTNNKDKFDSFGRLFSINRKN